MNGGLHEWGTIEWVSTPTQGILLGGLPHKNRGFFEWGPPWEQAPKSLGPSVGACLVWGPLEWGPP
jgi:hypothetical protein